MDRAIELSGISTGGPFGAVIIDKEGKIIDKNLRGEALEKALNSIFGN